MHATTASDHHGPRVKASFETQINYCLGPFEYKAADAVSAPVELAKYIQALPVQQVEVMREGIRKKGFSMVP